MKPRAKPRRIEDGIQAACARLLAIYENQGRLRFFHVPNGGGRSKAEGGIFKGMGVRAGVPDLVVLWAFDRMGGVLAPRCGFIEVKAPKGTHSPEQKAWRAGLEAMGFPWAELRDPADLVPILRKWGAL